MSYLKISTALQEWGSGGFTRDHAVLLIDSSQDHPSFTGEVGHPLNHCEITLRCWSHGRTIGTPAPASTAGAPSLGAKDFVDDVEGFASDMSKKKHSFAFSDEHIIQAVMDFARAPGAFMALHCLDKNKPNARLIYRGKASDNAVMAVSASGAPVAQQITGAYQMILDVLAPDRLQLQTLYPVEGEKASYKVVKRGGAVGVTEADLTDLQFTIRVA